MRSLKYNTYFVMAGQGVKLLLALLLFSVSCRYLGEEDFGRYALATTVMFFVLLFNDFGINTWMVREVARRRDEASQLFATAAGLKVLLIASSAVLVLVISFVMGYDTKTLGAILILAIFGVTDSFLQMCTGIFRAFERMEFDALVVILEKLLIVGIGIAVLVSGLGLYAFSWAFVIAGSITLLIALTLISRKFFPVRIRFAVQESKLVFSGAVVFGISIFLTTLYNRIDMIMLSVMKEPEVWSWYAAAHRLLNFTNQVPLVFMVAVFPRLSVESMASKDELSRIFTKGFKYLLILALPLVPGVIILAERIMLFFSGEEFVNAVPALQILAVDAGLLFLNIFLAGLFGATNNQNKLVVIQIGGLITNVVLNLLLIPGYAHVGAAYATVVTEGIVFLACFGYARSKLIRLQELSFLPKSLFAAAAMVGLLLLLGEVHVVLAVICALVLYFGLLLLLRGIKVEEIVDIHLIKSFVKSGAPPER